MYDDIAEETGYNKGTLQNIKSISEKINPNLRNENLSFAHHQQVAALPPAKTPFADMRTGNKKPRGSLKLTSNKAI
jgi:hypothetical protein